MYKNYYPCSSPIKWDDIGYVTSIKSCQKLSPMIKCSLNEFYCTAQSKCVSSQNLCIGNIRASNIIISRRLHQESSFSQNSEN